MPTNWRAFWDAKVGNQPDEYEDAFWPEAPDQNARGRRFAVADGATESSYSRHWARLLAGAYGSGATGPSRLLRQLPGLQETWQTEHQRADLPWYAAEKVAMGAFAALLGLRVADGRDGPWLHALAAGDCTLALVRSGALDLAWPVAHAADFGSNPVLLSSIGDADGQRAMLRSLHVPLRPGDTVFLMTDGIGSWFLAEAEGGGTPWSVVGSFRAGDDRQFTEWARDLRSSGVMHNDDVTALVLDIA